MEIGGFVPPFFCSKQQNSKTQENAYSIYIFYKRVKKNFFCQKVKKCCFAVFYSKIVM